MCVEWWSVLVTYTCVTNYPPTHTHTGNSLKQQLFIMSYSSQGLEIQAWPSWMVLAQSLSWSCSQELGGGCLTKCLPVLEGLKLTHVTVCSRSEFLWMLAGVLGSWWPRLLHNSWRSSWLKVNDKKYSHTHTHRKKGKRHKIFIAWPQSNILLLLSYSIDQTDHSRYIMGEFIQGHEYHLGSWLS